MTTPLGTILVRPLLSPLLLFDGQQPPQTYSDGRGFSWSVHHGDQDTPLRFWVGILCRREALETAAPHRA